jgi:seryl-tRNA synthetase
MRFPPVMPRDVFERTGYLSSFPDLMGSVATFIGDNADHRKLMDVVQAGGEWTELLKPAGVILCPAACQQLYSTLTGTLPEGGSRYDVSAWCYRHEPSMYAARMQSFRMHEMVFVGDAASARAQRDQWLEQGVELLSSLGLEVDTVVANDPFFGRIGKMLAENQKEEALKFEIVAPIDSLERPNAIASSNCHLDHFGEPFEIKTADGEVAHSCCFAFGIDRISLALIRAHGMDPSVWPATARARLWP